MIIMIDPGHGGNETGAIKNGVIEKDINLSISLYLFRFLAEYGYRVHITRLKDEFRSLGARCFQANTLNCDLFVSIHCNSFINESAYGFEVYHFPESKPGFELASHVFVSVIDSVNINGRAIRQGNFQVLRDTNMTAILIECGFLSNPSDVKKLVDIKFQKAIAESIALGIKSYWDKGESW